LALFVKLTVALTLATDSESTQFGDGSDTAAGLRQPALCPRSVPEMSPRRPRRRE
jgi:hypothetical protein